MVFIFLITTESKEEGRKNDFGKLLRVCYKESP